MNTKRTLLLWTTVFFILVPLLYANLLSVESISPSSANLCGVYPKNVTLTALNVKNTGNQTLENVTATLLVEQNNAGVSAQNPSVFLGTIASNTSSINPSWLVQCTDKPGTYIIYVGFSNPSGDLGNSLAQATSTITVYANDIAPPVVQSHTPAGVIPAPYVTLEVITNEESTCKYSTIANVAYVNQQFSFQITGGTSHKVSLENLADDLYHFYVRCKDLAGNEAQADYKIAIEINAPPTAAIKLSKPSPLRTGTTEVLITTSEPVKPVPSLSYTCSGNTASVPLTGSSASWKGYVILEQANLNEVCSFFFSAADLTGNPGTFISSGNIFLIDTQPPTAPTLLTASERKGFSVKLNWKYSVDDADHFNIYRLTDDDQSVSLYETSIQTTFIDSNVMAEKTYYYSVSAVDKAGNEGPVSEEAYVTIRSTSLAAAKEILLEQTGTKNNQSKELLSLLEIDSAITTTNSLLEKLNSLRSKLKEVNNIYPLLAFLERIKEGKVALLKQKEELGELKSKDLFSQQMLDFFKEISAAVEEVKGNIITEVTINQKQSFILLAKEKEVSDTIAALVEAKNIRLNDAEKKDYYSSVQELQAKVKVTANVQELEIEYLDGKKEIILLVEKEVLMPEDFLSNAVIIEHIPKSIASSVDEMMVEKDAVVLNEDPLLEYRVDQGGSKYVYLIKKELSPEAIKETITLAVPSSPDVEEENVITGSAVFSLPDDISFYDIGIAIGIILIVAVLVYSSVYVEKKQPGEVFTDAANNASAGFAANIFAKLRPKTGGKKITKEEAIYPHYAVKEYKTAGLTSLEDATLAVIMEKVDVAVNKRDYERAVKFYHLLSTHRDFAAFKKESAAKCLERVENKISLLAKQDLLQSCIDKDDYLNLRYLLNEVADLYNEVIPDASEKERNFLVFIKETHDCYSRILLRGKK